MNADAEKGILFTEVARKNLKDTIHDPYFRDMDSDLIYRQLLEKIRFVPFCEHLKRFIYQREHMTEPFQEVALSTYQKIIVNSFLSNEVPGSFTPTTAKLGAQAKNWLTQAAVRRDVVLLLGFGLDMSAGDVNRLLTKALMENRLDRSDPTERLMEHCYTRRYSYRQYLALRSRWQEISEGGGRLSPDEENRDILNDILEISQSPEESMALKARKKNWALMYDKCRHLIARARNSAEEQDTAIMAERIIDLNDASLTLEDHKRIIQKEQDKRHLWMTREISESDMEHILYAGLPTDKNGNLPSVKNSALAQLFQSKRLTRQRVNDILAGKTLPSRFDLITLAFLIAALEDDRGGTVKERYKAFVENTNVMLAQCGMASLYPVNPYESFVLLCILSLDPLTTFNDVWEMSLKTPDSEG